METITIVLNLKKEDLIDLLNSSNGSKNQRIEISPRSFSESIKSDTLFNDIEICYGRPKFIRQNSWEFIQDLFKEFEFNKFSPHSERVQDMRWKKRVSNPDKNFRTLEKLGYLKIKKEGFRFIEIQFTKKIA